MGRKAIIAGNWKMNFTLEESEKFLNELKNSLNNAKCEVVVCPPFISLSRAFEILKGSNIKLGAQNMHFEESGAFTGEISPSMLKSVGVEYVILGHSERRTYFNETNETINKKIMKSFEHGFKPILCVGETLSEMESNETEKVLEIQLREGLKEVDSKHMRNLVIAYEPIWAIGTGKTATSDDANNTIGFIRGMIEKMYNKEIAENIVIQYGGSVKPSTIKEQMSMEHIDGALVGGASLVLSDFEAIVNF